jgi:hypothetical protein
VGTQFSSTNPASIMKKQIVQVSVMQSAKVVAAVYLVTAIPIVALVAFFIAALLPSVGAVALAVTPVLCALGGFIGSAIGALTYNLVAARIGGFEFTTAEVDTAFIPH